VGIGIQDRQESQHSECEPNPTPSERRVRVFRRCQPIVFQFAAGITVSINLPSRGRERLPRDTPSTVTDWMRASSFRLHNWTGVQTLQY
jgi:hypothetical protein